MERKEAIRGAYRLTGGNNFYDGMITCSTLSGRSWAGGFAEMLAFIAEQDGMPKLPFIRK